MTFAQQRVEGLPWTLAAQCFISQLNFMSDGNSGSWFCKGTNFYGEQSFAEPVMSCVSRGHGDAQETSSCSACDLGMAQLLMQFEPSRYTSTADPSGRACLRLLRCCCVCHRHVRCDQAFNTSASALQSVPSTFNAFVPLHRGPLVTRITRFPLTTSCHRSHSPFRSLCATAESTTERSARMLLTNAVAYEFGCCGGMLSGLPDASDNPMLACPQNYGCRRNSMRYWQCFPGEARE